MIFLYHRREKVKDILERLKCQDKKTFEKRLAQSVVVHLLEIHVSRPGFWNFTFTDAIQKMFSH